MKEQIIRKDFPLNAQDGNNDVYSLHLILFSAADEMYELWLPAIPEGFFRFTDSREHRFLSVISKDGQWFAACKTPAFFQNVPWEQSCEVPLVDQQLLQIDCADRAYYLYVENVYKRYMVFQNCSVSSDTVINIGSQLGNEIHYNNPYVAARHAVLCRTAGQWNIKDCGSVFGVFVNGTQKVSANLTTGDNVGIMGLRIIIGPNFLSVNDCSGRVTIDPEVLRSLGSGHSGYSHYHDQDLNGYADSYFNRLPRKRLNIAHKTITVEGPPMSMDQKQMPMILRMGSSMVMGGAAALAGNFMTLITSVMFPFLSSKYTEKQRQEYEYLRLTKYREYLEQKRREIHQACEEEKEFLNRKYPRVGNAVDIVRQKTHLWERRPSDNDFLEIRLGTGQRLLSAAVDYPPRRFELESDTLEEEMHQLVEKPRFVEGMPIVLPIADTRVCGLLGERERIIEYIRQIVLQISAFHSYDEVKMAFFLNDKELALLDELRYLPHVWDDWRTIRFIATEDADAYKLGEYIKGQISADKEGEKEIPKILKKRPYYLIFALDKKLFECHEVLKEILQSGEVYGVSIFAAYDDLPKESQKIITLEPSDQNVCTTMSADGGDDVSFRTDPCSRAEFVEAMRILANTRLKIGTQAQEIPKMVTFLEMFQAGRVEQLNPLKRWKESNPVKSLAAPVGVGADGSLFMLDLHEKRQGPHGLVAGMTGSGKSEFIITYILSMAVNYHPDEVAFVLIDYKGGGLAGAFENPQTGVKLPHLVGTITNLDGASIQRSLMSIESELLRRQRIFNDVKSTVNEGTMDIYAYQKLYRAGRVTEPMPHLFIVSDEFAELKQQQPEFMDKLISAARIGRSLGVHLILATQKPSGVVNDQIRSNTKFRVCLRVQDRSDSMDMLKRPEAAELTDTGRFYLQVGYNEYFAMGQSAWCGAQYEPQDTVIVQKDDAIEFLDTAGQVFAKAKPKVKKTDSGMKQIVAIVEYLSNLAKAQGIQAKQLWQPELPKKLDLEELDRKYRNESDGPMTACFGLVDDPANMCQFPLTVDFETCGNMLIVGESGSGKTTIVQSILYSLSRQLSPEDFNFYALDYSGRMLKLFKPLSHCGAILQEEDVGALDEFFKLINSIIGERKKLFSQLEVDGFSAAREKTSLPLIAVFIDNILGLSTSKQGETHTYRLPTYLKNSANYGVKFIITCNHTNEVSSKVRNEISERICLSMRDKYDYGELLGCKVAYLPPSYAGRGLVKFNERPLEFHGAIIDASHSDKKRLEIIKESTRQLCEKYKTQFEARRLPVIKEDAEYEEFVTQFKRGRIPLGYSKSSHKSVALPMKQMSVLSLYFGNAQGIVPILNNLLYIAKREQMELWIIKRNEQSIFDEPSKFTNLEKDSNVDYLSCSVGNLRVLQQALVSVMEQRKKIVDDYCVEHEIDAQNESFTEVRYAALRKAVPAIMVLIEDVAEFCSNLNALSTLSYCNLLKKLSMYNIYVVGCFYPELSKDENKSSLLSEFSKRDILLFGGNFGQQQLCAFSNISIVENVPFNAALMIYRKETHALVMPCGVIKKEEVDEDLESIF